jgi:hypothetical protein
MNPPRRLRRVLQFCFFGLLTLVVLGGGGVWWAHRHLTRLTVEAVNRTFPDLQLSAKTVAFSSTGVLDLKAIQLRVREDGSIAVSIPSAQIRFSWRELQQHFIREMVIDQPSVRVSDALLVAVRTEINSTSDATPGTPWRIGKLTMKGGTIRSELAGQPTVRCGFAVQMQEGGHDGGQIAITALRVHDSAEIFTLPSLIVSASPEDLRRGKLREVVMEAPHLHINDRVLTMFPKASSDQPPTTMWSCDRLSIRRGKAKIELADWPEAEFEFAAQAEHVAAEGGGAVELSLAALKARLRGDEAKTLSVSAARVAGTMAGLARGTIQEIAIDEPNINVTERLLAWRPPARAAAPQPLTEPTPWKAERLTIKRGHVAVDLVGTPLAEFAFGVGLQNAALLDDTAGELQSVEVLDLALRTRTPGVEPFLRIPALRAEFRLPELRQNRRLARLRVEHLDFRYNTAFREMIASGAKPSRPTAPPPAAGEKAPPLTIGELRLTDGHLHLDDLGLGVPGIECRLETAFRELALEPGGGQGGQELQTIELSQIALRSPLDPFVTVLDLDTVFIRFTLAGIWQREIDEVAIVRPTLAIGPDLFWYIDRVQQNQAAPPTDLPTPADDGPPWSIRQFTAKSGQLVLALEGQSKLALPMPFESHAENLNFRRLSDLRLKLRIDMPEQDYDYPGYELALRGVSGRIEFSLPPAKKSNNVVNTLRLRSVQWKNFRGRDLFLDVTYDEQGIYGKLAGKGYTGLVNGQFNFLLTPDSDWNGWISGEHIDLQPITAALAPEKFSLSSPADFRLTVQARAKEILKVDGDFRARAGGEMRIGKLDDFIRELPGDWSGVKRGLSRISLETLRDFAYDTAHGDFHFNGLVGAVHLDLRGPRGSRQIEMNFHEAASSAATGRVATTYP